MSRDEEFDVQSKFESEFTHKSHWSLLAVDSHVTFAEGFWEMKFLFVIDCGAYLLNEFIECDE